MHLQNRPSNKARRRSRKQSRPVILHRELLLDVRRRLPKERFGQPRPQQHNLIPRPHQQQLQDRQIRRRQAQPKTVQLRYPGPRDPSLYVWVTEYEDGTWEARYQLTVASWV